MKNAVTDDQQEKLLSDLYSAVKQLQDVSREAKGKSKSLDQLIDIYLKENETRLARVNAYKPLTLE